MGKQDVADMEIVIQECIKNDKITFLATLICNLQKEYQELAELSTDGEYNITWTHQQTLEFLTYKPAT
jgi:hypothetical protein